MAQTHPWNVVCPTCGAEVGKPCVDMVYGYPVKGYHRTRTR